MSLGEDISREGAIWDRGHTFSSVFLNPVHFIFQ